MRDLTKRTNIAGAAVLAAVAVLALPPAAAAQGTASIQLSPSVIEIGTFSSAVRLVVDGTVAGGAQAVVVITGADAHETFNRKGRFGPIWISAGKVDVSGVPAVFLAFSAAPVDTFLSREAIDRSMLDDAAIKRRLVLAPVEADEPLMRDHYLALKLDEGTYRLVTDAVNFEAAAQGGTRYAVEFAWPATVPPGRYQATVYECRGGDVTDRASTTVEVREVGVAALVRRFAERQATVYGTLAVALMMSLGFGIDALVARFRRVRGRRTGRPAGPRAGSDVPVH